jgi:hypothetical protein
MIRSEGTDTMKRRWLLVSVLTVATLLVVTLAVRRSSSGDEPHWACAAESRAWTDADGPPSGGSKTERAAASSLAAFLASDAGMPVEVFQNAFSNSYDSKTGYLMIDGQVEARLIVTQLDDGTWRMDSMQHCMRPPSSDSSPGPTPS